MAASAIRKVALASCLVLCVSLLLPRVFVSRGWKQQGPAAAVLPNPSASLEGKASGRFPATVHTHVSPPDVRPPALHFPRSHLAEAIAKAKGGGAGGGSISSGRGLVGQIIPIYGFGILLYILYILFKLSSKGVTSPAEPKCPSSGAGNMNRKITDYELAQLQDKLRETEEAMEKLINRVGPNCQRRSPDLSTDQEKRLLQQLREITKVMKEGQLLDGGDSPEKEAEESPYMPDWEGYPEETFPVYDHFDCIKPRQQDTIQVDSPDPNQPSAEEIAERMEFMDNNEECLCSEALLSALAIANDDSAAESEKDQQTTFRAQSEAGCNVEKCPCCHREADDPAVLAENAGFLPESCSEMEELVQGELLGDGGYENVVPMPNDGDPVEADTLRERNTKGTGC